MGLFDEIAKGALNGVVGAQTAEFISYKLAESKDPTISHYRNRVDSAFVQTTKNLHQKHPKIAESCDRFSELARDYGNHLTGNAFVPQQEQEQPQVGMQQVDNPIQQLRDDEPGRRTGDSSMWDFE